MSDTSVSGLEELRRLFQTDLKSVRFPGVDGEVLEGAATKVQLAMRELERCQAELAAARQALADAEEDELGRAHRALAYARVYAEDVPELHQRLLDLTLPPVRDEVAVEESPSTAPKRRGRPKARPAPSLFAPSPAALLDMPEPPPHLPELTSRLVSQPAPPSLALDVLPVEYFEEGGADGGTDEHAGAVRKQRMHTAGAAV